MSANRNARNPPDMSARLLKARSYISAALVQSLRETATSHEAAARSMGVNARTVGAWVRGERPMTVEVVFASPRLAKAFRQALCVHEHEPLAYIARKGRR